MSTRRNLLEAASVLGKNVVFEGLLKKVGRFKRTLAAEADDILGFDYLAHNDKACYEFYCANLPLKGCTIPQSVPRPLGIAVFNEYKVDYKRAIEIFHGGNWGDEFASIVLYKPLYPGVEEPYWYFVSNLGAQVIIGADSGELIMQ